MPHMTRNRLLEVIKFELQFTGAMLRSRLLENTVPRRRELRCEAASLRSEAASYDANSRTTVHTSCGTKQAPRDDNIGAPITTPKWVATIHSHQLGMAIFGV